MTGWKLKQFPGISAFLFKYHW